MPDIATNAKEWDNVRTAFASSIMVETSLFGLAQNLEGPEWPIKDKDETPARYIDLSFEEVTALLSKKGLPPECLDHLVSIMKETLSFDQPFGDMVRNDAGIAEADDALLRSLTKFGVPQDYPIEFTAVDDGTREICRLEKLDTIGAFARTAREMSGKVIVGGDFRTLLNALSQGDAASLAKFLPLRPGHHGIHLPEAIALTISRKSTGVRLALARKAGYRLNQAQSLEADAVKPAELLACETELFKRQSNLTAVLFKTESQRTLIDIKTGTSVERIVAPLADPVIEAIVAGQLKQMLNHHSRQADASHKKPGFFARLFGRR